MGERDPGRKEITVPVARRSLTLALAKRFHPGAGRSRMIRERKARAPG
jgi:hypothetical protein